LGEKSKKNKKTVFSSQFSVFRLRKYRTGKKGYFLNQKSSQFPFVSPSPYALLSRQMRYND
jgi:hypothetical protein